MNQKSILITGGTGSFGKAFINRLLTKYKKIKKIVVFSRDELKQYDLAKIYPIEKFPCMRYFIGDVRDKNRLEMALRDIDLVVHAAALKQVDTAEYNPIETIKTNITGSQNIVEACLESNVKNVIALSTDKAVSPMNLYGATKLCSEKLFLAANNLRGKNKIKFSVVRYGNVMGSRGSVLPLFMKLYKEGKKILPLTHEEMTRFNISLLDATKIVDKMFSTNHGGEIYIPKIPTFFIKDLIKAIDSELKYNIIGTRIGEKLHEELINIEESKKSIEFKDNYILMPNSNPDEIKKFAKKNKGLLPKKGFSYNSSDTRFKLNIAGLKKNINDFQI